MQLKAAIFGARGKSPARAAPHLFAVDLKSEMVAVGNFKANLTDEQRDAILHSLLKHSEDGKLKKGELTRVSEEFRVCLVTNTFLNGRLRKTGVFSLERLF